MTNGCIGFQVSEGKLMSLSADCFGSGAIVGSSRMVADSSGGGVPAAGAVVFGAAGLGAAGLGAAGPGAASPGVSDLGAVALGAAGAGTVAMVTTAAPVEINTTGIAIQLDRRNRVMIFSSVTGWT
jgi:hypothetical protein